MNFLLHITFVLHMKESDAQMCHMIYGKPQRERVLEPRFQTTSSGSTAHSTMLRWHLRNVCLAEASRMFRVAVSGQGAGSGEQAAKRQAKDELRHLQSQANHGSLRWSTVSGNRKKKLILKISSFSIWIGCSHIQHLCSSLSHYLECCIQRRYLLISQRKFHDFHQMLLITNEIREVTGNDVVDTLAFLCFFLICGMNEYLVTRPS